MSIRISDKDNVFLYDSVTGFALNTESFESEEEAESFLNWLDSQGYDVMKLSLISQEYLDDLRSNWSKEKVTA